MRWCLIYYKLIGGNPATGKERALITVNDDTNFKMIYLPSMQRHLSCSKSSALRWPESNAGAWGKSRPAGRAAAGQDGLVRILCPPASTSWLWDGPWSLTHPTLVLENPTQVLWWSSYLEHNHLSLHSGELLESSHGIFKLSFLLRKLRCATASWWLAPVNLDSAFLSSALELGDRTQFLEPSLVTNFFNKWFTGKLEPQSSHLAAKSSLKHYNHMQIISFHPSFCPPHRSSSLWGETIKVTAGRELAQAHTALLRALLEEGALQRTLIDGIIPSAPRHTSLHKPVTIRSLVTLSPTALVPGKWQR